MRLAFKNYRVTIVSLILVLAVNTYLRAFPICFPQFIPQARAIVKQKLADKLTKLMNKEYANWDALAKEKLFQGALKTYKARHKEQIRRQIQEEHQKLKDRYQDPRGQTYLMELDCWHWARYVENVLKLGHPGDRVVNGIQLDAFMMAPTGCSLMPQQFLFYLSAGLYRLFSFFYPLLLFDFLFYLPLFFSAVLIALLFIFCSRYFGNLCAIIACLVTGLAPIFLPRSCAGWFDTDILNLLFPFVIAWAYLLSYAANSFKMRLFWLFISGFLQGLFSFTWSGWWFIFLILIVYELYSLVNLLFLFLQYKEKHTLLFRRHIAHLSLFLLFSVYWVSFFIGWPAVRYLYYYVKDIIFLNTPIKFNLWPNTYATVGEIKKADIFQITESVGAPFLLLVSLISMLALFLHTLRNPKFSGIKREAMVILVFWFIAIFFACSKGARFVMFLLIPLGVSLGWLLQEAYDYAHTKNIRWLAFLVIFTAALLSLKLIVDGARAAQGIFPLMNDPWYKVLTELRTKIPKNAVLNSWWDFGDWFKVVCRRRVIFDGQSQNTPQAYWMANVFLAKKEDDAIAILRMLNNGGNQAFELIDSYLNDPLRSVLLLKQAMAAGHQLKAEVILGKSLSPAITDRVIKLLFAKPQQKAYFVVDYSLQWKIAPISFLGNWDFAKVYLRQTRDKKKKGQLIKHLIDLGVEKKQAKKLYNESGLISSSDSEFWVTRRMRLHSNLSPGQSKNETVLFDNGYVYTPRDHNIYLYSARNKKYKVPKALFIFEQGKLKQFNYTSSDLDWAALLLKDKESYQGMLLDYDLAESLFVRLYFYNGQGLKHFKPLLEEKDGENYIRVFEIIWD